MSEQKPFERLRFFAGRLLTAADFSFEQEYFRGKLKLHNRALHGFGIVSGLNVTVQSGKVIVTAGLALDCEGNELLVATDESLFGPPASWQTAYVNLHYVEQKLNEGAGASEATIIRESTVLECSQQNSQFQTSTPAWTLAGVWNVSSLNHRAIVATRRRMAS